MSCCLLSFNEDRPLTGHIALCWHTRKMVPPMRHTCSARIQPFPRRRFGDTPQPALIRRPTTLALRNTPIHNPGSASKVRIALVGRATSAAPTYFPPVRIPVPNAGNGGERTVRFKDGGFGSNNPSLEIYNDVVHKHGGFSKNVSLFISVGTGYSELKMFDREGLTRAGTRVREAWANFTAARRLPARTQGAHNAMLGYAVRDNKVTFSYSRFEGGMHLVRLRWMNGRVIDWQIL